MNPTRIEIGEFKIYEEGIGVLTLNNPPQNTLPYPVIINIEDLKKELVEKSIKGIIITGSGRHFSNGAEVDSLNEMAKDPNGLSNALLEGNDVLDFLVNLKIPVIAAIEGVCFGGGLEIALSSHIRVCSERALFSFPEVELSLLPGLGGIHRLNRICSSGKALEITLSGEIFNSETAYKYKIIDHIVPNKEAFNYSLDLLRRLVQNRPLEIINSIMESFNHFYSHTYNEALKEEVRIFCELAQRKISI